ncbi:recombinase family protein [Spirulina sp. 06S082]|uniref:recombinase family protein n=1 Tax=Spirulina sp. 06S082 TaxID=3110248 RepID=UPI002B21B661|nr:recombinase family protein [Spirulina sp. 06S082]MEA5468008.1 recombinase family protein [Spirulina sp. 06S082]
MSLWIVGTTRSGKTTRLVQEFKQWLQEKHSPLLPKEKLQPITPAILIFAANDNNRRTLADRLAGEVAGSYPLVAKTPLGFIADEVTLFWPLLFQRLNLKAQFPLRLRPETEQELATQLWRSALDRENLQTVGTTEYKFIRQTLDLLQLAGASGIPCEDIPELLKLGYTEPEWEKLPQTSELRGKLLLQWRQWCLERGLLSYGIIYELYWRYLLDDPIYQKHLRRRFQAIFADDTDDYPAIAKDLFTFFLDEGIFAAFTYNPNGKSRLGLNADPNYLSQLSDRCDTIEELKQPSGLSEELADIAIQLAIEPVILPSLPPSVSLLQAISRAALLRQTAEFIIDTIQQKQIEPREIAIIAPGLDAIARYTLIEILTQRGIEIEPLNEQRPLISSPLVRALLTLLPLVYDGLGRLLDREAVGEMLVILSRRWEDKEEDRDGRFIADIDPVRAGILADRCYYLHIDHPHLKPGETYPRWDRLGHRAMTAYEGIRHWIEAAKARQQTPRALLDRAMKDFLWNGSNLTYPQLAALRELMETARHFWETDRRLRQNEPQGRSQTDTIAQFIQLLRRGTITANARPARPWGAIEPNAITLATIFQYRSLHRSHRWHFWLDVGSNLWQLGGSTNLFASPLFLKDWSGFPWMPEDNIEMDKERLERVLRDLLARVDEKLYLCHSDLAVNGTEQTGPLLSFVHAALPLAIDIS